MKSFNEIYKQVYSENYEEVKLLKKKKVKAVLIALITLILATVVLVMYVNSLEIKLTLAKWFTCIGILILLLCFLAALISIFMRREKYTTEFKKKIIEPLIANIDENLRYKPIRGLSSIDYKQGEFGQFNNLYSDDLIIGKLDGKYDFQISEVRTEYEAKNDEGKILAKFPLFTGLFGYVRCSKNIGIKLKIRSDKGKLGKLFEGKTKVEMDSQEFEKYFDVYGDNKVVAMQLLTSDVMKTMMDFIKLSRIKYEITIKNDRLYVRFHTGPMFEPPIFKSPLDYNMLKEYYDIIKFVLNVTKEVNKVIENMDI